MGANLSSSKHAIMKNPVSEKLVDQYSLMFRDLGNDLWIGHYNVHGLIPGYDSFNYPDDIGDEEVIKVNLLFRPCKITQHFCPHRVLIKTLCPHDEQ
jgi:hypothetical protein